MRPQVNYDQIPVSNINPGDYLVVLEQFDNGNLKPAIREVVSNKIKNNKAYIDIVTFTGLLTLVYPLETTLNTIKLSYTPDVIN